MNLLKQHLEAEESVAGAMVLEPQRVIPLAMERLVADDFASQLCRDTYNACIALYMGNKPVDVVTVLGRLGEEQKAPLVQLCQVVPTTRNVESYIEMVRTQSRKAKAQQSALLLMEQLGGTASLEECQAQAVRLCDDLSTTDTEQVITAQEGYLNFYKTKMTPKTYIKTGVGRLDKYIYLDRGDYVIIGGRPSAGKTAFTLQMMLQMAREHNVVYFSLETSAEKIMDRLMANYTGTPLSQIKTAQINDWKRIASYADDFGKLRFSVVEAAGWSVQQIRAKAIQLKAQVVFIDYLSLIKANGNSLYEKVTNISIDLHTMAQQSKITVVALSQLNRSGVGEPDMTSLRESGQIEQDADAILLLHAVSEEAGAPRKLIVAKNKEGQIGSMTLDFCGETQQFRERETRYDERG